MQKLMIIGGSSFLAGNFMKQYAKEYQICTVSRSEFEAVEGIQQTHIDDYFDLIAKDFTDYDAVILYAAIVHRPETPYQDYLRPNAELPIYLARQAEKAGVKRFIQISSIAVFGECERIDTNAETDSALQIRMNRTPYGESKLVADTKLMAMKGNLLVSCVRPPMVYGGGKAPGNMARLIKLVQTGFPLPFKGGETRDFLHVNNLSACLHLLLNQETSGIFYPTDACSYTSEDLVRSICMVMNKPCRIFRLPGIGRYMLQKSVPDLYRKLWGGLHIEKQHKLLELGYAPQATLEEGIAQMLKTL